MKAISWRFSASLITMSLIFIFTGKVVLSISIGIAEVLVKMIFYFVHERAWNKVQWGKIE